MSSFYTFSTLDKREKTFSFAQLQGKVVLIVNVASKCHFTKQYKDLKKLEEEFKNEDFVILAFPCNQFLSQEPDELPLIWSKCQVKYGIDFPMMNKVHVNGEKEAPIYSWLKQQRRGVLGVRRVLWNFEKFLIDRNGSVAGRYSSFTKPSQLIQTITTLLKQDCDSTTEVESSEPDSCDLSLAYNSARSEFYFCDPDWDWI